MSVSLTNGTTTVTVADLLEAPLRRPLRRTVLDLLNSADYTVTAGTPGRLTGTLTYLCDTLADAMALDTLYQGLVAVTLTTGTGNPLNGFKHLGTGDVRYNVERAVPGKPPKWSLQVDVREVA